MCNFKRFVKEVKTINIDGIELNIYDLISLPISDDDRKLDLVRIAKHVKKQMKEYDDELLDILNINSKNDKYTKLEIAYNTIKEIITDKINEQKQKERREELLRRKELIEKALIEKKEKELLESDINKLIEELRKIEEELK